MGATRRAFSHLPISIAVVASTACVASREAPPASPGTDAPTVVAVGDIACPGRPCPEQRATADLTATLDPEAVLILGDVQYVEGSLAEFRSSYEPTWGRFADRVRPVPGNHEYGTPDADGYFAFFGEVANESQGGWYSFNIGGWHVVAINSGSGTVSGQQLTWVGEDLEADRHRCELAFWHHPRFSSGTVHGPDPEPQLGELWGVLHRAGVDVVVNGHQHNYERFTPLDAGARPDPTGGIRQFVVGTGGRSLHPLGVPLRGSEERIDDEFGVLELTLRAEGYGWRFIAVSGETRDDGSDRCHG